jgi:hypothetical protein
VGGDDVTESALELAFAYHWRLAGGPPLAREHRFAVPRKWRMDFAHLPSKVAIEAEGGIWSRGRHVRGRGFEADAEKYNAAQAMGWVVFRLTAGMPRDDPGGAIRPILDAIHQRMAARRAQRGGGDA